VRRALAPLLVDPAATAIVSDFDGTLSPIVDRPDDARPLDGTAELLVALSRRFKTVAVVSGRPVSFLVEHLTERASVPDPGEASPLFVGLYGLEVATADGRIVPDPEAEGWRPVIDEVAGRLRSGAPAGRWSSRRDSPSPSTGGRPRPPSRGPRRPSLPSRSAPGWSPTRVGARSSCAHRWRSTRAR
jgi:hypothetical protein